jgi:hypothetical protein
MACPLRTALSALAGQAALRLAPSALTGQAARRLCSGFPATPKWQKLGESGGGGAAQLRSAARTGCRASLADFAPPSAQRAAIPAATGDRFHARPSPHTPLPPPRPPAEYATLEVWDTSEVDALAAHLKRERARLFDVYRVAKEEQRKVVWKDAQFDLRRLDRLEGWVEQVRKDPRRAW